jgi:hypothetical protein
MKRKAAKMSEYPNLGVGVDLTMGLRPVWHDGDPANKVPFFAARQNPVATEPVEAGRERGTWHVEITLHDSPEELAGALQPISIATSFRDAALSEILAGAEPQPNTIAAAIAAALSEISPGGMTPIKLPLGSMTLCDADRAAALQSLSDWLGLKVGPEADTGAKGYALVRWRREDVVRNHAKFSDDGWISKDDAAVLLTEAAKSKLASFRPGAKSVDGAELERRPTPAHAENIVKAFAEFGTHVVTQVTLGEEIFQVFSYAADAWKEIRNEYKKGSTLTKVSAVRNFSIYFLQPRTDGIGFVHEGGHPRARSGNPALDKALAAKLFDDGARYPNLLKGVGVRDPEWQKTLTATAPIAFRLVPLTDLLKAPLSPISDPAAELAHDLFAACIYLKFKDGGDLLFRGRSRGGAQPILGIGAFDALSNIATKQIDLFMPSLALTEVDVGNLVNPEVLETVNILGLTIEIQSKVELAGNNIALAAYTLSGPRDAQTGAASPATIIVPDAAFDAMRVAFGAVEGVVAVEAKDGKKRQALVRGLVLRRANPDSPAGRWLVKMVVDRRTDQWDAGLFKTFQSLIELSLVTAETLLRVPASNEDQRGKELAAAYLRWLAVSIKDAAAADGAKALAARIAYLGQTVTARSEADEVPPFSYDAYKESTANILKYGELLETKLLALKQEMQRARRDAAAAKSEAELAAALKQQAVKLNGFIDATAGYHRDAAGSLAQLIRHDQATLKQQLASVERLRQDYLAKANLAKVAVGKFIEAKIGDLYNKIANTVFDYLKFGFDVVKAVALEDPGGGVTALQSLFKFFHSVQDLAEFSEKLRTIATKVSETAGQTHLLQDVQSLLMSGIEGAGVVVPSEADWQNLVVNIKAVLRGFPSGKEIIEDAYVQMANTGAAWVDAQIAAHSTAREIYANTLRREVEDKQGEKLKALASAAAENQSAAIKEPSVDLVSMGGVLQARLAQAQAWLAQVLLRQDQALVYEYFKQPLKLEGFDLTSLAGAVAQQSQTILDEATRHRTERIAHPIPYEFFIPLDALTRVPEDSSKPDAWTHRIALDRLEFMDYAHVRVNSYDLVIEGLELQQPIGEKTQTYWLEVCYNPNGDRFYDRDWDGNQRAFYGLSTVRGIEVTAKTGANSQSSGDGPNPIRVTPFSSWSIRLDTTAKELKERGIAFVGLQDHPGYVRAKFAFHIQAVHNTKRPRRLRAAGAAPQVDGTLDDFLKHMVSEKQSALHGWDVVFSMREQKVNTILANQWDAWNKQNGGKLPPLPKIESEWVDEEENKHKLTFTDLLLGQPKLQFSDVFGGEARSIIKMALAGGNYETRTGRKGTISGGDLTLSVPLNLVHGTVDADGKPAGSNRNIAAVVLNFEGSKMDVVTLNDLKLIDPKGKESIGDSIRAAIVDYFKTHNFAYRIQALDLSGHAGLIPGLTPHDFFLRTVILDDADRKFLQLFINTNAKSHSGGEPSYRYGKGDVSVATPVPVPDGFDCALMINSMILFRDVMQKGFENVGLSAKPVDKNDYSDKTEGLWTAFFTGWDIGGGSFDLGNSEVRIGPRDGWATISANLATMTVKPKPDKAPFGASSFGNLAFDMPKKEWTIPFEQRYEIYKESGRFNPKTGQPIMEFKGYGWKKADYVGASLSLAFEAPLTIEGKGDGQQIKISLPADLGPNNWNADARLPNCPSPQDRLRQQISNAMNANMPGALSKSIKGFGFAPVSVFALQNLLFPAGNRIALSQVHIPGDLVILGHIETAKT